MYKSGHKHVCDVCEYGTNRQNSFKKHLETQKHIRNSRESSVTIDIKKHKMNKTKVYEKINIEIYPENIKEESDNTIQFLKEITNELTQLRQENMLLKLNMEYQYPSDNSSNFASVFDDDFTVLFA